MSELKACPERDAWEALDAELRRLQEVVGEEDYALIDEVLYDHGTENAVLLAAWSRRAAPDASPLLPVMRSLGDDLITPAKALECVAAWARGEPVPDVPLAEVDVLVPDLSRRAAPEPVGVEWRRMASDLHTLSANVYEAEVWTMAGEPIRAGIILHIRNMGIRLWPWDESMATFPTAEAARAECSRRLTLLCEATKTEGNK